jgi:hypothetical protein
MPCLGFHSFQEHKAEVHGRDLRVPLLQCSAWVQIKDKQSLSTHIQYIARYIEHYIYICILAWLSVDVRAALRSRSTPSSTGSS